LPFWIFYPFFLTFIPLSNGKNLSLQFPYLQLWFGIPPELGLFQKSILTTPKYMAYIRGYDCDFDRKPIIEI